MEFARDPLAFAHDPTRRWFNTAFDGATRAQAEGWESISRGESSLILAPTGSGKTLAAFLTAIDRLMFRPPPEDGGRLRVLYISPLKALGVDVDRNLRAPLAGIAALAQREGVEHWEPRVGVRSGDTPAKERERQRKNPPDILITTPESLYLLLTSRARENLRSVETVIVDEVHAIAGTKRGAHLWLSLERLEALRPDDAPPLQRIGLSATQRPLERIARALGGSMRDERGRAQPRAVHIVDAGRTRRFDLRVEVPVEDMTRLAAPQDVASGEDTRATAKPDPFADIPSGGASQVPRPLDTQGAPLKIGSPSIWTSIHPRLVELIRAHRSTMIFVNARRLAERLAAAINEVAGEALAAAHHGSLARDQREEIEDRLKRGRLPAIVATSSLELGIDMGAIDLVIQIEAPPSIAAGIQRIGRAGHHVGGLPKGVVFPKYRADLLACAAATSYMQAGLVEPTKLPHNPLDVLAQQIVAMVALEDWSVEELFALVRRAAPFVDLPRASFEGVLDLLSGRYPSDEFAALRPRVTWDRIEGRLSARRGSRRLAISNGGTIPDRGLYGVFLATGEGSGRNGEGQRVGSGSRVGELDEEMVFESHVGDVFVLGASSWRIVEITHDRVLVLPAPGEPGRMPFWHGDNLGRPLEFGRAIGALSRELSHDLSDDGRRSSIERLVGDHGLEPGAAENLLAYLDDQLQAAGALPTDQQVVIERCTDEAGDWRVMLQTPFGARVHAPWATAVVGRLRQERGLEVDVHWNDDGVVFRVPEADQPPAVDLFIPASEEIEELVIAEVASTAMFASRFRENAGRALLLTRRQPGRRTPLWIQRKKASDLLQVASSYRDFPIVLETYRECLQDVFDLPGLTEVLQGLESRSLELRVVDSERPSPFASALLFGYVANFLYDADAPLAERRAQALSLDHAQLRALLGEVELHRLLDPAAIEHCARRAGLLDPRWGVRDEDGLHDRLLGLGDLRAEELAARCAEEVEAATLRGWLEELVRVRRVCRVQIAGEERYIAAEDAGRYRDALGTVTAPGLPSAFLEPVEHALVDLSSRWARTHGPFTAEDLARRWGIGVAPVRDALETLAGRGRILRGRYEAPPPGDEDEDPPEQWCDAELLQSIKRRSLAKLRDEVEAVDETAFGRFTLRWQRVSRPQRGLDGLLDAVEGLQGLPLAVSVLDAEVLPARVVDYHPAMLDELCAAGELVWRGHGSLGRSDGRISLYLAEHAAKLAQPAEPVEGELAARVREFLAQRGASFHREILSACGGFEPELLATLWEMVWAGELSNDTLAPLRSRLRAAGDDRSRSGRGRSRFRSRRASTPGTEGRWYLFERGLTPGDEAPPSPTEVRTAWTWTLLERHGVLTREAIAAEGYPGGFSALYPVLRAMEDAGRVRRGYFVAGLGAAQFALPGADESLRRSGEAEGPEHGADEELVALRLAATDPANPYGAALGWPQHERGEAGPRLQRAVGAHVLLHRGRLVAYLARGERHLWTFFAEDPVLRRHQAEAVADGLRGLARPRTPLFLETIDGLPAASTALASTLAERGWERSGDALRLHATLEDRRRPYAFIR